jgi:hypothetical protein
LQIVQLVTNPAQPDGLIPLELNVSTVIEAITWQPANPIMRRLATLPIVFNAIQPVLPDGSGETLNTVFFH